MDFSKISEGIWKNLFSDNHYTKSDWMSIRLTCTFFYNTSLKHLYNSKTFQKFCKIGDTDSLTEMLKNYKINKHDIITGIEKAIEYQKKNIVELLFKDERLPNRFYCDGYNEKGENIFIPIIESKNYDLMQICFSRMHFWGTPLAVILIKSIRNSDYKMFEILFQKPNIFSDFELENVFKCAHSLSISKSKEGIHQKMLDYMFEKSHLLNVLQRKRKKYYITTIRSNKKQKVVNQ